MYGRRGRLPLNVYLPPEMIAELHQQALDEGLFLYRYVEKIFDSYLKKNKRTKKVAFSKKEG